MESLPKRECAAMGCERAAVSFGWCDRHYRRWKRHGTTELRPLSYEERFWAKVQKHDRGCWEWTAAKSAGYGSFGKGELNGERRAHRIAYTLRYGDIPDGLNVLHKCDNRVCVNPDHLYLGSIADNNQDKVERGQSKIVPRGLRHYAVRLTPAKVRNIRVLLAEGKSHKAIAKVFEVSEGAIYNIAIGRNWKHVQ